MERFEIPEVEVIYVDADVICSSDPASTTCGNGSDETGAISD